MLTGAVAGKLAQLCGAWSSVPPSRNQSLELCPSFFGFADRAPYPRGDGTGARHWLEGYKGPIIQQ